MWGNRTGWLISFVMVIIVGGGLYVVAAGGGVAAPTAFSADERHFAPLLPPGPSPSLLPAPDPNCDGGANLREAIAIYTANPSLYENFASLGKLDSPEAQQLTAIDKLLAGANCARLNLFADHPADVIGYAHTQPPIDALQMLGRVLIDRLALLSLRGGRPAAAAKYAQAGMALGLNLCRERVCWAELDLGLELVGKSSVVLTRLAEQSGEANKASAWRALDAQRIQFVKERIDPVARFVRSIDPRIVGSRSGDVFELAKHSRERMWRVEAILALGRLRYFVGEGGTAGTQRAAGAMVRRLAEEDPDPVIRAAAGAAARLSIEEYRMQ